MSGSAVQVFCSEACLRGRGALVPAVPTEAEAPKRARWWVAAGVVVGGTLAALSYRGIEVSPEGDPEASYQVFLAQLPAVVASAASTSAFASAFAFASAGGTADPAGAGTLAGSASSRDDEERRVADDALLEELKRDAWIHPLAGPRRRMPVNHVQAFGAAREGAPPPECLSGHCGVDVAGVNIWGEPVHAVHDGVVDWVNRGPNEDHGGVFVKIAHREGTLFTWYFHLAAVPKWVQPGAKVSVGRVIGLVGDTGVKRSAPHLHFAMTVKPHKRERERYIDPEPLLAIWPLWLPEQDTFDARMLTEAQPGLPVRAAARWVMRRQDPDDSASATTDDSAAPGPPTEP